MRAGGLLPVLARLVPSCSAHCPFPDRRAHASLQLPPPAAAPQDGDSDGASSIDSGIAESVSGLSVSSRPSQRPGLGGYFALGRPSQQAHPRTGLGSVLGGGGGPAAVAGAYHPASPAQPVAPGSGRYALAPPGDVAHSGLEVAVHSAQIRYRKPLSTPIFTLSVRPEWAVAGWKRGNKGGQAVCCSEAPLRLAC